MGPVNVIVALDLKMQYAVWGSRFAALAAQPHLSRIATGQPEETRLGKNISTGDDGEHARKWEVTIPKAE